jgi:hypothetical protein
MNSGFDILNSVQQLPVNTTEGKIFDQSIGHTLASHYYIQDKPGREKRW